MILSMTNEFRRQSKWNCLLVVCQDCQFTTYRLTNSIAKYIAMDFKFMCFEIKNTLTCDNDLKK